MKYILIKADTNDGDYITSFSAIQPENELFLKEILNKVQRKSGYSISWETLDIASSELYEQHPELSEEECEFLNNIVPQGEHGIHTIEDIQIYEVISVETLL